MLISTVGIFVFTNNKVLLVRHEAGSGYNDHVFGLPSGRLYKNENEIETAVRELEEETGLKTTVKDLTEFPNNYYISKLPNRKNIEEREIEYSWRVFLCKKYTGELHKSPETSPSWHSIHELDFLYLLPNVKNAVMAGLNFINRQND